MARGSTTSSASPTGSEINAGVGANKTPGELGMDDVFGGGTPATPQPSGASGPNKSTREASIPTISPYKGLIDPELAKVLVDDSRSMRIADVDGVARTLVFPRTGEGGGGGHRQHGQHERQHDGTARGERHAGGERHGGHSGGACRAG